MLKRLLLVACFALPMASHAVEEKKTSAPNPQHSRMSTCNKEAGDKNLKGEERKKHMKECLAGKPAAATNAPATSATPAPTPAMAPAAPMTSTTPAAPSAPAKK